MKYKNSKKTRLDGNKDLALCNNKRIKELGYYKLKLTKKLQYSPHKIV